MSCTKSQAGSFTLLIGAFLIPVAMLVMCYSIDLAKLNSTRSNAQFILDQASLMSAKKLPYIELAKNTAISMLQANNMHEGATYEITSDNVKLTFQTKIDTLLLKYANNSLNYKIVSNTAINSKNTILFLDASSYLAPNISNDVADAWSETTAKKKARYRQDPPQFTSEEEEDLSNIRTNWPYARYFRNELTRKYRNRRVPAKLLTQQCFNPAFSALKEATIRIYDYISASKNNSVGIMMGPGNVSNIEILKNPISAYDSSTTPGEARFDYFRDRYNADEFCLAAMQYEKRHKGYNVPERSSALPRSNYTGASFPLVNNKHRLPAVNLPHLNARDIIWSLAVRRNYENDLQIPKNINFNRLLEEVTNLALSAQHNKNRSGFNHSLSTSVVLLMGDLPWINGERIRSYPNNITREQIFNVHASQRELHRNRTALIREFENKIREINQKLKNYNTQIQIYYNFTRHYGNYPPENYPNCVDLSEDTSLLPCAEFIQDGEAFEKILSNFRNKGVYSEKYLVFKVLRSPDIESLVRSLPAWLPMIDRTSLKTS
jgi:hypothetical protein